MGVTIDYDATPNNESNETTMGFIRSSTEDVFAQNELDKINENQDENDLNSGYYAKNEDNQPTFELDYSPNVGIDFEKTTSHDVNSQDRQKNALSKISEANTSHENLSTVKGGS